MQTISNSTYHSPTIPVRVMRSQRDAMLAAAETLGMSQSELMRAGIAHMILEAEKVQPTPKT
jgi:hypothetical protein